MANNGDRLDSWKAIAEYLGRDRTTVMRWEHTAGLPVRRVAGAKRGSVFAYKGEIDQWLTAQRATSPASEGSAPADEQAIAPQPESISPTAASAYRPLRVAAILAALAVIVSAIVIAQEWQAPLPLASASLEGEEIVATDAAGREAWRYRLPHTDGTITPARLLVTDVDGDGRPDVLAALQFIPHGSEGYGTVMLLDARGRLRWERPLDDRYRFGSTEYAPSWYPEDVVVYRTGGSVRIAVAQHHHTWWPSVVITYDAGGRPLDRFVNAGWIRSLNITADGRYLLAAGISNGFGGAVLTVLDLARPSGTSPAEGSSLPECANCPAGSPVAYFVLPWTEIAHPSDTPNAVVYVAKSGAIEWHAIQRAQDHGKSPEVIVSLSPGLDVLQRSVNDYFVETHALLEHPQQGALLSANWREPAVRKWTAAGGWKEIR
jgi:hypothetical protein